MKKQAGIGIMSTYLPLIFKQRLTVIVIATCSI
jgi:hypothetical protein